MDKMKSLVLAAMKEKSPELFRQLSATGKLQAFLRERADQIGEATVTRMEEIARQNGVNKAKTLEESAGILKMSDALAREQVLAEMLEFPQAETFPSSQDETTSSEAAI